MATYYIKTNGEMIRESELRLNPSISYIDLDEGELCHWKYIKREKLPNGKWRYYYDQSELDAKKSAMDDAEAEYVTKQLQYAADEANYQTASRHALSDGSLSQKEVVELNELKTMADLRKSAYVAAGKKYVEAQKNYRSAKRKGSVRRAISKGIVAVANFFSKFGKKK